MDDRTANRDTAPGASGFKGGNGALVENLGEGPETLRTGNRDEHLSGGIVPVGWNPDGRQETGATADQRLAWAGYIFHDAEEECGIAPF